MNRFSVGIDIGATTIKLGLVDVGFRVLARSTVATGPGSSAEGTIGALGAAIRDLSARVPGGGRVREVGVGSAGLIDTAAGVVRLSPNLPTWRDVPLRDRLTEIVGVPVTVLNDADAFGFAEGVHGAGAGCRSGLFVTLGTGVGGALVLGGKLYRGAFGTAGELGHMCVDVDGEACPCGGRGCLERFVGSARIVERAERKIGSGAPGAAIVAASGGPGRPITPKTIALAAAGGDWTASAVFAEIGEILGLALVGVANLLSLDVVVIGGGVADAGDVLWKPMRDTIRTHSMAPPELQPRVVPPRFGLDAGLIGAAAFARAGAEPVR